MKQLILASFCVFLMTPALAASPKTDALRAEARLLCDQAGINKLFFGGLRGFPQSDYCLLPDYFYEFGGIHSRIHTLLKTVTRLNQEAAQALGLKSVDELFEKGRPELTVVASGQGPLNASISKQSINIGVFMDWNGQINEPIYVHELGHMIATRLPDRLAILSYLNDVQIFREMIPDFLASQVTGELVAHEKDLPQCLQDTRPLLGSASFDFASGYFQVADVTRGIKKCCEEVDTMAYPRAKNFCHSFSVHGLFRNLPEFDPGPLDTKFIYTLTNKVKDQHLVYDSHRLGVPVFAFFQKLSRQTGRNILKDWVGYLESLSEKKTSFTCNTMQNSGLPDFESRQFSWTQVLKDFRTRLNSPKEIALFDQSWTETALDKSQVLMFVDQEDLATKAAVLSYYELLSKPEAVDPRSCRKAFRSGAWLEQAHECHVVCWPTP